MSNNQCKNLNDIIIESDLVLENLNNIIDSHSDEQSTVKTHQNETKNFVQNFLKKSESFKKLTNFSSSNKKVPNRQKLDSLSSTNIEKILSKKIDSDNSCPHLNSISKQDKIKSKSYFINSSESSSPIVPSNLRKFFFSNSSSNTISGTKTKKLTDSNRKNQQYSTSFVNTPKKKRSSLFNLFSFTKSSSNSSQNLSTKENAEVFSPVDYDNVFSDTESDVMSPKRPQSECVSNPEWFTNLKFFNNKKSYKLSDKQKNSNKLERSSLILVSSNENIPHETKLIKKNSIYCKGFSIPLNASYCPNSTPPLNNEKKLGIRLKYAEIKQIEDDFNDENQSLHQAETNRFETLENKYRNYNYNTQQQQKEANLIDDEENRCCSPSPSILTLSLNNKCSTATKTLTQNLNSINFVDNLNSNMFSQQQNESKSNIIKVMSNQKEADLDETHSNCNNNELSYKKKRFQQFQTQSLIDINVQQLAKVKNDQCLDSLNSNTNKIMLADDSISSTTTTTKSIQNPLFKMNGYQTIEEDTNHISKLKQSYSSSSTFLNNEPMSDLTIRLNSNSKPIFKSVKLRKGFKLKDILKPVFSESNINMDDYDFYQTSDTSEMNKNSVDLNKPCDEYIGTELYLKNKNTFSENRKLSHIYLANEEIEGEKSNLTTTPTFSSINWQNYFGTKSYKNNKQKRNSCIAVMNDYNSSTNQTVHSPLKNSSSASITSSMQSNYTSFVSNNPVNSTTSSNGSERIGRGTRHFKRVGQIASIFASYSNSKLPEMANPLNDLLNLYTKDLPKLPDELTIKPFDLRTLDIESDWNKFVGESFAQSLPIKKAKQQMAIWELFVTECSLIKSIKIVIDVFLNCLINLKINEQTSELFKDIEIKKLFFNITEVYNCNVTLWQQYLYPTLNNLINGTSLSLVIDPQFLIHTFSDFKNLFKPYEEYCLEQNNINDYFKKKTNENENLAKLITWAENHPLSGRLKFSEYMIMPVQRITRYHILIENISQYTDDEAKREQFSLIKEIVNSLPNSINMKLGYIAQFNDISESIEKYEGIQGQNEEITEILSEFKKFDIKAPLPGCSKSSIRELIHQGPLRLKDIPKSVDVHCFLFTDMLLITQLKKTKKYKIIKPPVSTHRMIIKELTQTDKAFVCISLNDYNVPDSVYMFISNQSKKWIEFLELAKQKYLAEKQRFNEINYTEKISPSSSFNSENIQKESLDLTNRSISIESNESNSSEKSDLDTERRDSSATLTENIQLESTVTTENVVKSPVVQKKLYKNQFGNGTRIFGGRLDRPRRNMTDPNQHCNEIIDKNSITKRNSLNDRPGNMKPSLIAQTKLNFFAESTSTILSTDSGVSNCDNNQISFSQESITKNSPIKIIENVKNASPSSPTSSSYSSSSNDPIYSNLSMSSSSSSNCSKYSETIKNHFKPQDEDFYEDEDLIENDEEDDDNTKTITADQITEHDNIPENNFIFKKIPNFRIKQPTSENIKMIKANFENLDLNKMENENFRNDNGNRITIRKPLIRIRPTNIKNEAIRLRSEQFICNNLNSNSNYDSTVDSAQLNLVNNYNLDNHHRMVLVNLLHTTLDSTEV